MKLSSSHLLCLMSGILLILVTSIKAEYEWNGKEWIWKETPTDGISEGSGDMDYDETDEESYDTNNGDDDNGDDDEDYSDGSGDDALYDGQDNNPPPSPNNNDRNLNQNTNNYDGSKYDVQITPAPDTPYDPYSNGGMDSRPDNEDIIVDPPQTTFASPVDNNNNNIDNQNNNNFETKSPTSFFAQPGTMAAVIGGAVVGLLCAILCVMFVVYRMRKKDEGSYALDEPKRSPTVNSYSKPPSREFYA